MKVRDFNASKGISGQLEATGFQATELSRAANLLKTMFNDKKCTRFLAFTSNMMASGLRGIFVEMAKKKLFDAVITAGGSLDHDFIRSFADYEVGSFQEDDVKLHRQGVNRIGNILVPNRHYAEFEKRVQPILKGMYSQKKVWSAREIAFQLGESLKDKNSFLFQCARNSIPVYSPGIVDSALGLQFYYFKQGRKDFAVDATGDMGELATQVLSAKRTGALILGGGISKHYTIACNLIRGGLDYSVYVSTSAAFDGSLSGASPREAKSWGKIREKGRTAAVNADATIVLPLLYNML